jgi:hypothetical protein
MQSRFQHDPIEPWSPTEMLAYITGNRKLKKVSGRMQVPSPEMPAESWYHHHGKQTRVSSSLTQLKCERDLVRSTSMTSLSLSLAELSEYDMIMGDAIQERLAKKHRLIRESGQYHLQDKFLRVTPSVENPAGILKRIEEGSQGHHTLPRGNSCPDLTIEASRTESREYSPFFSRDLRGSSLSQTSRRRNSKLPQSLVLLRKLGSLGNRKRDGVSSRRHDKAQSMLHRNAWVFSFFADEDNMG